MGTAWSVLHRYQTKVLQWSPIILTGKTGADLRGANLRWALQWSPIILTGKTTNISITPISENGFNEARSYWPGKRCEFVLGELDRCASMKPDHIDRENYESIEQGISNQKASMKPDHIDRENGCMVRLYRMGDKPFNEARSYWPGKLEAEGWYGSCRPSFNEARSYWPGKHRASLHLLNEHLSLQWSPIILTGKTRDYLARPIATDDLQWSPIILTGKTFHL